jgi:hypothetical protein
VPHEHKAYLVASPSDSINDLKRCLARNSVNLFYTPFNKLLNDCVGNQPLGLAFCSLTTHLCYASFRVGQPPIARFLCAQQLQTDRAKADVHFLQAAVTI